MNRLIGIASAMLLAMLFVVPVTLAADPATRGERVVISSGADVTLPADQSVDVFIVYRGTARIEGHASTIVVVDGAADLVGATADGVIAIQGTVSIDPATRISGDVRRIESAISGATTATVAGAVRDLGPDMFVGWWNLGAALALVYAAFAISALFAALVLAGLASRQVRAATTLISNEPATVVAAGLIGLIGLVTAGILAIVTVVGIPFGFGVIALVLPGLFVIGYIVAGIWLGELILSRSSTVVHERPYGAAVIGMTVVGLVSIVPPIGGVVSFVGFGAVVLLSWRILRGTHGAAASAAGVAAVAEAAS